MSDNSIIFAKPRHLYHSYTDLYSLIDLSSFQTCFIDQIDPQSNNAYIITILNGEIPNGGYPDARARIILTDLEYHLDGIPPLANVELWAADSWYAKQINARYVPMGSHPDLRPNTDSAWHERYDVAWIGYFDGVPRRQVIRQQLIERGVKVSPGGAWGDERHRILSNSTAYLHVHQHQHAPTIAPLRMVVAAAYELPVITETVADYGIFGDCSYGLDYANIAENVHAWTHNILAPNIEFLAPMKRSGAHLHQKLCVDYTFRRSIEQAL